ncbi:MAG: GldG family protein [Anaerolineales bacterium]|jgi:ABC-type uncharacterized transport system involved in gliding motility auxiliary subunit
MRSSWRRFAPFGLYLSGLAAVASAGLYIVQREWNLPLQICLGLIVIGLAVFAILDPGRVRAALTGRQARYGSNALVLSVAFVGILVVLNFLVFQNPKRWDLTADKQFTLAPETLTILQSLPDKVQAEAFFSPQTDPTTATKLLDQYKFNSKGKFDYQFIDPVSNPVAAQQANITRDGTIVLSMGGHQEQVTTVSEQEITGALVRLINPETSTVYFLTGHGEYSPDDTGNQSYSQVKQTLVSKNYTVKTLNLLADNQIPSDAKAIIIAGPRKPLSQTEVDLLDAYLKKGGSVIVMEDPTPVTDFGDAPDPLADYLKKSWGVVLGNNIVIDQTSNQPFAPYAAQYGVSPITQKMQRITSQFPTVRSVEAGTPVNGVTVVSLVKTAPQSWAETDLNGLKDQNSQITFDPKTDQQGPISLAATAENTQEKSRVVVFGDADFASDAYFTAYANSDLFTNAVDWAARKENLINLTPKQNTQRLMVPPQRISLNLIFLGMVFVLPGLALFSGISVWLQRRRRG